MTLFRKYYKDANNDIKANDALINSVIENARKKKSPPVFQYYKYAAGIAAAVIVVSAAVISAPFLEKKKNNNSGVIIEESVIETASPLNESKNPDSLPDIQTEVKPDLPENDYADSQNSSNKIIPQKENKIEYSYNDYDNGQTNANKSESVISDSSEQMESSQADTDQKTNKPQESVRQNSEDARDSDGVSIKEADVSPSDALQESVVDGDEQVAAYSEQPIPAPSKSSSNTSASGGANFADSAAPMRGIPSHYRLIFAEGNRIVLESSEYAITIVIVNNNSYGSEPVYSCTDDIITVRFAKYGCAYEITASNVEMNIVEELVKSIIN